MNGPGEKQDGRAHIERTADYLIKYANLPPKVAHQQATETRKRVERRES